MSDVLSQNEIDTLLSALSSGAINPEQIEYSDEKHKVKSYDFRSPQKFSKEHIRTLELVHDNFAKAVSNYLTAQLRKNVRMRVEAVEQITYDEFIRSIQNPTMMTIFRLPPLSGSILFECNPEFSFGVIDMLLGGSGKRIKVNKEYTEIDKNIMLNITTGMISNLKLAWEDILSVDFEVEGLETNPAVNQTLAPNEAVALISFSVEIGKLTTFVNMCIPYLSIEKVLDKLLIKYWVNINENTTRNDELEDKLRSEVEKVNVGISAELGETTITVQDFLKLGEGDVIRLDKKCTSPIEICVENEKCFYAQPGTVGKNKGVSILDTIDKDVNEYE